MPTLAQELAVVMKDDVLRLLKEAQYAVREAAGEAAVDVVECHDDEYESAKERYLALQAVSEHLREALCALDRAMLA